MSFERHHGDYLISDDPGLLDIPTIHRWLSEESYWAQGRTLETVERSMANSLVFGVYDSAGTTVGGARVVTDRVTFGWLCDVFVVEEHRGHGLGKALVRATVEHPDLVGLKRYALATRDAHSLYAGFGFEALPRPERWMMKEGPTA